MTTPSKSLPSRIRERFAEQRREAELNRALNRPLPPQATPRTTAPLETEPRTKRKTNPTDMHHAIPLTHATPSGLTAPNPHGKEWPLLIATLGLHPDAALFAIAEWPAAPLFGTVTLNWNGSVRMFYALKAGGGLLIRDRSGDPLRLPDDREAAWGRCGNLGFNEIEAWPPRKTPVPPNVLLVSDVRLALLFALAARNPAVRDWAIVAGDPSLRMPEWLTAKWRNQRAKVRMIALPDAPPPAFWSIAIKAARIPSHTVKVDAPPGDKFAALRILQQPWEDVSGAYDDEATVAAVR